MSDRSSIGWTDATWNPTTGCTKTSPGCAHCYIERTVPFRTKRRTFEHGHIPLQLHAGKLEQPLRWKKPKKIFVNSLSDLFHDDIPDAFIDRVFAVMALCPQHTFQILTKRAERMRHYANHLLTDVVADAADTTFGRSSAFRLPLPNVWLGVSVENQPFADERIPLLLRTPAAVRFISAEPLLGSVDLMNYLTPFASLADRQPDDFVPSRPPLNWVIVGGESGPTARPMDLAWPRSIIRQCHATGVACFIKQLGSDPRVDVPMVQALTGRAYRFALLDKKGSDPAEWPADLRVQEFPRPA